MITIVSATNRKENDTLRFAQHILIEIKKSTKDEVQLVDLSDMSGEIIRGDMYNKLNQSELIRAWQDQYMIPANKFWFVIPEYNGSFPGILKLFIDSLSIRKREETFSGKKACITGIATGRAGNIRGMDHLTDILNHLLVVVYPNKLPISQISSIIDHQGKIADSLTREVLQKQISEFVAF